MVSLAGTPTGTAGGGLSGTYPNPSLAGGTLTQALVLAANGTSLAPAEFQSGSLLTTPAAGAAEFDGTCFYETAAASSRQIVDTEQIQILSGTYTLANNTNPQALLNATAAGALTVQASTAYLFECVAEITGLSSSSHTISFGLGGSAGFTSIFYEAITGSSSGGNGAMFPVATAAATAVTGSVTVTTFQAVIKGIMRISTGGTIVPQVTQNTASAAATVAAGTYFRAWPIGAGSVTSVGDWS
jgi:hypothetical protein